MIEKFNNWIEVENEKVVAMVILTIISAASQRLHQRLLIGDPGQIKITVFYDVNSNDIQDAGEPGTGSGFDRSGYILLATDPARYLSIETDEKARRLLLILQPVNTAWLMLAISLCHRR